MCVAVPGKIVGLEQTTAAVDFSGTLIYAQVGLVPVKIGDYVLVHAGCIIQVLSETEMDSLLDIISEIENA